MRFSFKPFQLLLITACFFAINACQTNISRANLDHQEIISNSSDAEINELLQTDANRMSTLEMRNNLHSLYTVLNKLYKRNPREWRKIANSREAAEKLVHDAIENNISFPGLNQKKSVEALYVALDPNYKGDRVGSLVYGLGTMLIEAHGGHTKFYISDVINAEYLYNAARNIEIAQWMLRKRTDANGNPLLLSNEISKHGYNLSFAIELAKIIARLDLVAAVLDERFRRVGTNYVHGLLFLTFFPVQ